MTSLEQRDDAKPPFKCILNRCRGSTIISLVNYCTAEWKMFLHRLNYKDYQRERKRLGLTRYMFG